MLLQLTLAKFSPVWALFETLIICLGVGVVFAKKVNVEVSLRTVWVMILFGVVALMFRMQPFLYVDGGQDEGIYVSMSSYFAQTGESK